MRVSDGTDRETRAGERDELRHRSKLIFGNLDRLDVVVAVAGSDDGLVCAADLENDLGLANNRVRAQLKALAEAELLDLMPRGRGDRIQWYQRRASPLWDFALRLYEDWSGRSTQI